jgi:hypothetical protein
VVEDLPLAAQIMAQVAVLAEVAAVKRLLLEVLVHQVKVLLVALALQVGIRLAVAVAVQVR